MTVPFQATVKSLSVERPVDGGAADAARAIIAKVATGHLKQKFGSRDIIRAQWSMLRDRDTVHAALDVLVDHDWLDVQHIKTGGRTRTVYEINPKVELPNKGKGGT